MSPAVRLWGRVTGRVRHEATAVREAVRAAPRRTVVTESVFAGLVLLCSLTLFPLVPPADPVAAALQGVWATLLVPARRMYPALTVVCCVPVTAGDNVWAVVVVPFVVWSAVRRITPARRAWGVVGASSAGVALVLVVGQALTEPQEMRYLAAGAGVGSMIILLPALSGIALGRRRPLTGLLRERNAYLEQARFLTDEAARMEERARIAAEMHDLLGHRIGLISMHAGALQLAAERQAPPLAPRAELLHTTAATAMDELRGILGVLRHQSGEDIGERGTREALSALVADARGAGADAELRWNATGTTDADPRTRQAVHRVTREGLTNALKHAPGAPVRVTFDEEGDTVTVAVVNDAPPAPRSPGDGNRSGLVGLQERIGLLGGALHAGPRPEGGFALSARIPVRPDAPPAYATSPASVPATLPTPVYATSPRPVPGGAGSRPPGSRPPLSTEVLTWPRLLGGGCAALLVLLPMVGGTIILLVMAVLH
ncbi:two-component sensor histidine kinase [Streptomyces armeniacus]|uniref:histidine kinase n=1 Tax=Streptomyces armeniacus TaxID=83291 RepID=A0A345XL05_9ACTN|nr:histidine kinase [Streptomyces armeniacus]AXK32321.1 two-component sensor histidine kinase [Streptomyces armeniacus]